MALERILEHKRQEVAARRQRVPQSELEAGLAPSDRSLADALAAPRTGYILECKKASPSRGVLRPDFDPAEIARTYGPWADALSVLTDEHFFGGQHSFLRSARQQVSVPVLCKDFVLDPYQVVEARAHGADAVLLMLSVLDDDQWRRCYEVARAYGLDVLTEAHDGDELQRALALDAPIIGINNRNLHTLEVALSTTRELAPRVGNDRLLVCESGIANHADVARLRPLVDAFLVGSALMGAPDLSEACRRLVHGRVKVCGLTSAADARLAADAGATHGGLIFADGSPRQVSPDAASEITIDSLQWVGVFVNEEPARVAALAADLGLAAVQLHGDEDRTSVQALRKLLTPGCEIWKAHRVRDRVPSLAESGADRLLLDAHVDGQLGGTGQAFDWDLLGDDLGQVVLAGGLTPDNAAHADALGCWGLDVSSGVESAPGRKSETRLRDFFAALRGHGRTRP